MPLLRNTLSIHWTYFQEKKNVQHTFNVLSRNTLVWNVFACFVDSIGCPTFFKAKLRDKGSKEFMYESSCSEYYTNNWSPLFLFVFLLTASFWPYADYKGNICTKNEGLVLGTDLYSGNGRNIWTVSGTWLCMGRKGRELDMRIVNANSCHINVIIWFVVHNVW